MNNTVIPLPYGSKRKVIYDNDSACDVYTDELLMALASAGKIDLLGIITTNPVNPHVTKETFELDVKARESIYEMAMQSGMKNIPKPVLGSDKILSKPASGRIEDTIPVDCEGSRLIVQVCESATAEEPIILVMGGPLTIAACAYLLNPSIADKLVIAWLGATVNDMAGYNGAVDPWASYIAIEKLRMVVFPVNMGDPQVPKQKLQELPDSVLKQWMIDKKLPWTKLPGERDADSQPVISLVNPYYVKNIRTMSFSHCIHLWDVEIPVFKTDPNGKAIIVTEIDDNIGTNEWWSAMTDSFALRGEKSGRVKEHRPFFAAPFPIGKITRIEAEDYDHGENGVAFCNGKKDFQCDCYRKGGVDIRKGKKKVLEGYSSVTDYYVSGLKKGDWLKYTIALDSSKTFDIHFIVGSSIEGGEISVFMNDRDYIGEISIPNTGGEDIWKRIKMENVFIEKGEHVMTLFVKDTGASGMVGNIDGFVFSEK